MVRESQLPQRVELLGMLIGKKSTYMTWRRLRTVREAVGTLQTSIKRGQGHAWTHLCMLVVALSCSNYSVVV